MRNAYKILVGKPESRNPLWRSIRKWEGNMKRNRKEIGCKDRDWINLAYVRLRALMNTVMNIRDP